MYIKKLMIALCAVVAAPLSFSASPAVAYSEAGKFDSSFNEAVFREGVAPYRAQYGHNLVEIEPASPAEYVSVLTRLAEQGRSPIVAVGFSYGEAVAEVASQYPDLQFTILDSVVDLPNVQSILFKEYEGSFVVGAVAALKAKKNTIGFVGGVNLPFITKFGCGYAQGAHYINSNIQVLSRMISDDFSGFADTEGGYNKAAELIDAGAEVIYAAAGGAGNGVYDAAAENSGVYAIGVDSNQNFLHVGTMLTSMVKNVGVAAFGTWHEAEEGTWKPGVKVLGLAENGVDWKLDIFNRDLITVKQEKEINKIREDIISGKIRVIDYTANNNQCPVALISN
ncbi:BMP family lipoprotein [Reinekea marinisedimentorum]|uniref:Basic membrane protein A n=1 Tax=Reinekea marinisedimentorum TaxID=230495 RepID=A0A4R3IDX9_9GAMM|nr:BMP family ABC transporter substrate-binding protein [Reinekea marinisedimentorum]TCS43788.1 basic membrane protein A [Reinekea marinisedimentorum]